MIKKTIALFLAAVLLVPLTSCSMEVTWGEDESIIVVTDHNGNEVKVPKDIQRIVVADIFPLPSVLAVFFDSAEKLIGIPSSSMSAAKNGLLGQLFPSILNASTAFSTGSSVNIEELISLSPDIVFYSSTNETLGTQLRSLGIAAVAVSANKWQYDAIETLNQWIALFSEIFEANDKTTLVRNASHRISTLVSDRVKNLKEEERKEIFFLFQYSATNIATSGKLFWGEWWANAIGAINVAGSLEKDYQAPVSMEQIYDWNPQVILMTNFNTFHPEDLYKNTVSSYDWSEIDAVKNKEVYKMPLGMYRSFTAGVDTPITLLWLAKTVYPVLFEDIDIIQETIQYYRDIFGVELTEEMAEMIFSPNGEGGKIQTK